MNCAFDKEKLTGYYDGELEAAEKAEVERHIASCSECLRELGELKSAAILVKELPRLRAPRSIAEGIAREMQTAGKVHSFARMRRTILWASAAAAALFVGLNVMYFARSEKSPVAASAPAIGKIDGNKLQEEKAESAKAAPPAGEKDAAIAGRRATADRTAADEALRESRKQVEESKELRAKAEEAKKVAAPAPVERAREKEKADGLAKGASASDPKPAAEPPAPAKPTAAPPAPPVVAKPAPTAPPPAAEAPAPKKDAENLARAESDARKRGAAPAEAPATAAVEAPPTHLTLASTQLSKARPQVEEALRKMGVAVPAPAPGARAMKAPQPRETEIAIPLELTDSQIARLRQELDKPGSSRLLAAAPGDPVLAEFRDGRMFGKKESGAAVAGGAGATTKSRDLGKADAKSEVPKDSKESKDADPSSRGLTEGAQGADKSAGEPRRRVILHLIEVPYVPDTQPAPDTLKK